MRIEAGIEGAGTTNAAPRSRRVAAPVERGAAGEGGLHMAGAEPDTEVTRAALTGKKPSLSQPFGSVSRGHRPAGGRAAIEDVDQILDRAGTIADSLGEVGCLCL